LERIPASSFADLGPSVIDELTDAIVQFRDERDWRQFHSVKNLAMSVAVEAGELMELLQWAQTNEEQQVVVSERRDDLRDELADVLIYVLLLCREVGVSPVQAVLAKIEKNRTNYPAEQSRGSARKYTEI
jgi:NTP pyrophosphatase (non-canonical NTP hydrolase)